MFSLHKKIFSALILLITVQIVQAQSSSEIERVNTIELTEYSCSTRVSYAPSPLWIFTDISKIIVHVEI